MSVTLFSRAYDALREGQPFVLVILVGKAGSASRKSGRMVVLGNGSSYGTIGGGSLESFATGKALQMLVDETDRWLGPYGIDQGGREPAGTVRLSMERILPGEDDRLFALAADLERFHSPFAYVTCIEGCGNRRLLVSPQEVLYGTSSNHFAEEATRSLLDDAPTTVREGSDTYFVDIPQRCASILLIGGGHVSQAVAKLADEVGFEIRVLETRKEFARRDLFPHARSLVVAGTIEEGLEQVSMTPYTAVVIAAHAFSPNHLERLLASPAPYIGLLSSRNKERALQKIAKAARIDTSRLFCPIGLDIGSETPQEIAVSVIAEIMKESRKASGNSLRYQNRNLVVVRGAGDLATGTIIRLHNAGFSVVALETERPTAIRRTVSLAQAMFDRRTTVENVTAVRCDDIRHLFSLLGEGVVPVIPDPQGTSVTELKPLCVVDAIHAKRNRGTRIDDAPLVIALGPGFVAGRDCHAVIETRRGHSLGRILTEGRALPDSGTTPGFGTKQVIGSPQDGIFHTDHEIGNQVAKGDRIADVDGMPVIATTDGMVMGLLNDGLPVTKGSGIADIDPRGTEEQLRTCSDKAKAIAGGVLEVIDRFDRMR
jgi:xanthine dehydrogenase accessory factor